MKMGGRLCRVEELFLVVSLLWPHLAIPGGKDSGSVVLLRT